MFKAFYSLSRNPFLKEIDTNDLFPSDNFKEVEARLDYLKKTREIGVLVGEPGSVKTTSLRSFANSLNSSLFKVNLPVL